MGQEPNSILIIDDDTMIADLLAALLQRQGYLAAVAHDAEAGLEEFEKTGNDLVLCDIFMEGMGGIDAIKKIRSTSADVPIIAMSAGYNDMEPEKALKAAQMTGASGVLAKPFEPDLLLSVVETFLSKVSAKKGQKP